MSSKVLKPSASLIGDLGSNPAIQGALAAIIAQLLGSVPGLIAGLFNKKPKAPVTSPTPAPVPQDEEFPDDHIPTPPITAERIVTTVRLKLARAQYSKQRFPQEYTEANPFGLVSNEELRAVEEGRSALNYASKFWLDLTAYDQHGKEFLRDAVLALGLEFKTEFHVGDASIKGNGDINKVETVDSDLVGNGITAYNSSLGFLHQMKAHGEGESECSGSVNGVSSNTFTLKVS